MDGSNMPGAAAAEEVMRGFPPPAPWRVRPDAVYSDPAATRWFMRHVREVERTADLTSRASPGSRPAERPLDLDAVVVEGRHHGDGSLATLLRETCTDGILVLCEGSIVYERYFDGFAPGTPHLCHSITKSVASCVAAALARDGVLDPEERVVAYVPELDGSAYGDARVRHLLDMTVGIRYLEDHENEDSEDARLDRLCGLRPGRAPDEPGSAYDYATTTVKEGEHGRVLHYVSLNTDVLGWVMERASGTAVPQLIRTHVWSHLGGEDDAYIALDGAGSAQLDGGLCCSLRDLGRFAQMLTQGGWFGGTQIVPGEWIEDACRNGDTAAYAAAADCAGLPDDWSYRNCFWVGEKSGHTPFLCLGMYGQMVYVDRKAQVAVVKFSSGRHAVDDAATTRAFLAFERLAAILGSDGPYGRAAAAEGRT
jgi:CubicO group peptidase (beta-lactamase class C family)